jgi:soluble lytic murein transglycosylase
MGADRHLGDFLKALYEVRNTPGWRVLTAELAQSLGRANISVRIAKRASREGDFFIPAAYPVLDLPVDRPESALLLAVIRQESGFDVDARSRAGARGLMQLLPRTARKVARGLNLRYAAVRLTTDPDFNLSIGAAYLGQLLDDFSGSYLLALTAYNAGPSRARRWIEMNGDPRDDGVDPVDWVEMIPYQETRNYVQRILETLQVYRLRVGGTRIALNLRNDLSR